MNKLMTKWLDALESGNYKQGQNKLRKKDNFCCLGVLCDIYDNKQWSDTFYEESIYNKKYTVAPPHYVWAALELGEEFNDILDIVMEMNDIQGKTFSEIAQYIRQRLNPSDSLAGEEK